MLFALDRWRRSPVPACAAGSPRSPSSMPWRALAAARRDNPEWTNPNVGGAPLLTAEALGHPLIPRERRIANDVAGRSARHPAARHWIEHVGQEHAVARHRAEHRARAGRWPGLRSVAADAAVRSADQHQDPGLARTRAFVLHGRARPFEGRRRRPERSRDGRMLLYLLDEILQGTNSAERGIAVQRRRASPACGECDRRDDHARLGSRRRRSRCNRPRGSCISRKSSMPLARWGSTIGCERASPLRATRCA